MKNFLLTIVTLTIYRFWAKTNVRRHVWSNIKINGQALEYTGTGMELFLGALIIFAIIGLPFIIISVAAQFLLDDPEIVVVALQFVFLFGFMLLYGMAVYRARRYRLSRTLWRGIRGTLTGSSFSFSMLFFGSMLLKGLTWGWSTPAMNLNIQQRMFGDMMFGDKSFKFKGPAGPLYARYAICWILTPVIIIAAIALIALLFSGSLTGFEAYADKLEKGDLDATSVWYIVAIYVGVFAFYVGIAILWTAYTAREMMLFAEYTTFDNARFRFDVTVLSLIGLWLGNLLIMIFTLGIGQP
ncbi:MAG: YjgN family protein, partial [Hyphomicrobiales bacterium]|nr:YjgN family protein [Hyphomicrobiales bacterium]